MQTLLLHNKTREAGKVKKSSKKAVGALGAGMVAGMSVGALGLYMFSNQRSVKKAVKKASKVISGLVGGIEDMM